MSTVERRSFFKAIALAVPALSIRVNGSADSGASGFKVAADEDRLGKQRAIGFNTTTFKVASSDTAGALFAMEQHALKPGGPPLHLHHAQDEFWYVVSGKYVFQIGSERYNAKAGDCLLGPRGLPHAYAFIGSSSGRLLIAYTPAGRMQEYFERPRTPGTYVSDAELYHQYGMELLGPPLSLK